MELTIAVEFGYDNGATIWFELSADGWNFFAYDDDATPVIENENHYEMLAANVWHYYRIEVSGHYVSLYKRVDGEDVMLMSGPSYSINQTPFAGMNFLSVYNSNGVEGNNNVWFDVVEWKKDPTP
jgi:hypothetical protein